MEYDHTSSTSDLESSKKSHIVTAVAYAMRGTVVSTAISPKKDLDVGCRM